MRRRAHRIVDAPLFGYSIVVLIIASAIVQAVVTAAEVSEIVTKSGWGCCCC